MSCFAPHYPLSYAAYFSQGRHAMGSDEHAEATPARPVAREIRAAIAELFERRPRPNLEVVRRRINARFGVHYRADEILKIAVEMEKGKE